MAAEWYVKLAGKQLGPLSPTQLKTMAKEGKIVAGDPVRRGKEGRWVPAARVKGLIPPAEPAAEGPAEANASLAEPSEAPPAAPDPGPPGQPPAEPAAASLPTALPATEPAGEQAAEIPLARPATEVPAPPILAPPPLAGFHIDADARTPTARVTQQPLAGTGGRGRRRKNEAILVVVLAVLFLGLVAVWLGMVLPATTGRTASESGHAAKDAAAPKGADAPTEVVIPGLDEYLDQLGSAGSERIAARSKPPAADPWVDASESPVQRGDVSVKITSAEVGLPRLIHRPSGRVARPETECLTLRLELYNKNKTKKLEYTSWSKPGTRVSLVDDHENSYSMRSYLDRGFEIDGQVEGGKGSLYPEEATEDVLAFEKPAKSATRLRLELPASAFGQRGTLRFEIPISMVVTAPEPVAKGQEDRADSLKTPEQKEDDGGPIPVPGLSGDAGRNDRVGAGFADAPNLPEADELRQQPQGENRERGAQDGNGS